MKNSPEFLSSQQAQEEIQEELGESGPEIKAAKETIERELGIDPGASREAVEEQIDKAIESKPFLRELKGNPGLRKALRVLIMTFVFLRGGVAEGQVSSQNQEGDVTHGIEEVQGEQETLDERLLKILQEIELFRELRENPEINLRVIEDTTLYSQGIYGAYVADTNPFRYGGILKMTPFRMLSPEDTSSFKSTVYHELVHVEQDHELHRYFFGEKRENVIPEWKMRFYFANLPDEEKFHIGAELDAYYRQALFEKQEMENIEKTTLAGFFTDYMVIQRTGAFRNNREVRELVSEEYERIVEISGYTLESFLSERRQ